MKIQEKEKTQEQIPEAHIPVGAFVSGDITTQGGIRIDGHVSGGVSTGVHADIGPDGHVEGSVKGTFIRIAGCVDGNVNASDAVQLLAGGSITGELHSSGLMIEEGAHFSGPCLIE